MAASRVSAGKFIADDPLSAYGETHWTEVSGRDNWRITYRDFYDNAFDKHNFYLTGRIEAYENDNVVFERDFAETIARQWHMNVSIRCMEDHYTKSMG